MATSAPVSIIIGSYNDIAILEQSLAAFAVQTFPDFELVIADDGSNQDYKPILSAWASRFRHGIQHATHEKRGFRKARILNRAISVSRFERLIFVDMDCLPRHDFVENHLSYLQQSTAIIGRRVHVSRDVVPTASEILRSGLGLGPLKLVRLWASGKARVIEHGFAAPIFYESSNTWLIGSNFSAWRRDLFTINGYNEEFEGWGKEDAELGLRLQFSGVRVRNLRNKVIQYHLIHDQLPQQNRKSDELFERTKAERRVRGTIGLAEIREGDFSLAQYDLR